MNAEALYIFLDRFNNSIKLEYCFAVSKLIMKQFEISNPEECGELYKTWESIIREKFNRNIEDLETTESLSENDKKMLNTFLESLLKEINT
jgi:hypothetical protein